MLEVECHHLQYHHHVFILHQNLARTIESLRIINQKEARRKVWLIVWMIPWSKLAIMHKDIITILSGRSHKWNTSEMSNRLYINVWCIFIICCNTLWSLRQSNLKLVMKTSIALLSTLRWDRGLLFCGDKSKNYKQWRKYMCHRKLAQITGLLQRKQMLQWLPKSSCRHKKYISFSEAGKHRDKKDSQLFTEHSTSHITLYNIQRHDASKTETYHRLHIAHNQKNWEALIDI